MRARLLLDSELVLWALAAPARLTRGLRERLDAAEVYVSAASILEIGTRPAAGAPAAELLAALGPSGFLPLAVTAEHAALAADLPGAGLGAIDRVLVAQATAEGMTLLTTDAALAAPAATATAPRRSRARKARRSAAGRRRARAGGAPPPPARCPIVLVATPAAKRRRRA
jgi:PIN domain nuclease of toxin-antitoxin system